MSFPKYSLGYQSIDICTINDYSYLILFAKKNTKTMNSDEAVLIQIPLNQPWNYLFLQLPPPLGKKIEIQCVGNFLLATSSDESGLKEAWYKFTD